MYIQNRYAKIAYRSVIVLLAFVGLWLEFISFGEKAWRLLTTWYVLIAGVYYGVNIVISIIKPKQHGAMCCSMLHGAIILTGLMLLIGDIAAATGAFDVLGLEGIGCFLTNFLLPILIFLDWIIFVRKGTWRVIDPWYWLAWLIIYAGIIILTARGARDWPYPYSFLDYQAIGIDIMIWWILLISVIALAAGYAIMLLDFALSGEIHKYIVMPRIKTIVIEEEIAAPSALNKLEEKKPAKTNRVTSPEKMPKKPVSPVIKNTKITVEGLKDSKSAKNIHDSKNRPTSSKPRLKKPSETKNISQSSNEKKKETDKTDKPKANAVKVTKNSKNANVPNVPSNPKTSAKSKATENSKTDKTSIEAQKEKGAKVSTSDPEKPAKKYPKITKYAEKSSTSEVTKFKNKIDTKTD